MRLNGKLKTPRCGYDVRIENDLHISSVRKNRSVLALLLVMILLVTGCGGSVGNEPMTREGDPWADIDWMKDSVVYEVNVRQSTMEGTFDAFREQHLDRLSDLGVDVLWLMPIYPISTSKRIGSLGSYYAIRDYTGVNQEFGDMEDFIELVDAAHERGMKVVLDWVANHTGWDNAWIKEHPDWYTQIDGQIVCPPGTGWEDVADLDYNNEAMRKAMIDSMAYWVKEGDIDGFRCDYAAGVPRDFWEAAATKLNKIKPMFMLAEDNTNEGLLEYAFVANYNWDLLGIMNQTAGGTNQVSKIQKVLKEVEALPEGTVQMNFITNHDENSWNGTVFERYGESAELMAVLTFMAKGIPLIYSGQEAAMQDRLEFFDKDNIDWSGLELYQPFYKALIDLKKDHRALDLDGSMTFRSTSSNSVLAFSREKEGDMVYFIGNFSADPSEITLPLFEGSQSMTMITGDMLDQVSHIEVESETVFTLNSFSYIILTNTP